MPTPETAEKSAIKQYLDLIGAFHYHNMAGIASYAGIPDITVVYKGQVYQIEVKAQKGRQSEKQLSFQARWEYCGGIYILGGLDAVMKRIQPKKDRFGHW